MSVVETYKALADESRLRLLSVLRGGSFNVQELTEILRLGQSTVSHHLKTLQGAGLIRQRKEGTWSYYTLAESADSVSFRLIEPLLGILDSGSPLSPAAVEDRRKEEEILARRREQARHYFDSVAGEWQWLRKEAQGEESFVDRVVPLVGQDEAVVELGCGSGALLSRLVPRQGVTIGVDYSSAMLDEARRALGTNSAKVELRLGHLEHLPIADESVEVAIAYMVMHHVASPLEALRDAFRVVKPGGRLIIVDLAKHNSELMRERYADLWLGFDADEFTRWVREAGFADPRVEVLGEKKAAFLMTALKG